MNDDRLSDELIAEYMNPTFGYDYSDPQLHSLAREVQESRTRIATLEAAIDGYVATYEGDHEAWVYDEALDALKEVRQ